MKVIFDNMWTACQNSMLMAETRHVDYFSKRNDIYSFVWHTDPLYIVKPWNVGHIGTPLQRHVEHEKLNAFKISIILC